jgi:hypothetical protein
MSRDCNLIKLKRGLSTEWADLNPVLKLGEPGYEKDTKKLKIGDGVTLWNDLPYIGAGTVDFEDVQDEVANFLKAGNNIVLDYDDPNNILTISASGLQPAGNYATLVNGLVPEGQLPSYVDDVLEFNNLASFPSPGETGKIYVALDSNKVYRWSGSTYIEISSGPSSSDDVPEGSGNLYYTKDRVNDLLQAGSNISLSYDNTNIVISTTGLQPSGNYSVVGHTHTSSNITDFNSSVSGLLPTVANSGDNRILTSTGTSNGINAENNLTFDGSLLSVSGNLVVNSGTLNSITFNNIGDLNLSARQLAWNSSEGSLALALSNTYDMYLGGELHYRVRNETGSPIIAGTAVYASGVAGGSKRITVAPKAADGSIRETRFMGLVTENINNGVNGFTTHFGYIRNIDTRGDADSNGTTNKIWASGEPVWAEGDILYVHPTAEGKLTKIEPKHSISVAIILNRHQSEGKLFVRPTSYGHLDDNHDVSVSGATNGQFLQYNSATDYWIPSSSGNFTSLSVNNTIVSVSGHTHTTSDITDFNSSVSGLLPVINNSGDNRILTSDGTSTGINAEDKLIFIPDHTINGVGPSLIITEDGGENNSFVKLKMYTNTSTSAAGRIQFEKYRGTQLNPSGVLDTDLLGVIRWLSPDYNGNQNTVVSRILCESQGQVGENNPFIPTKIVLNTSNGNANIFDTPDFNTLILDSSGTLTNSANGHFIGSFLVDNGLSSPTPILNLGSVSGNVSISYGVDKQIQTLTLNGTNTNLIKGSDWPTTFSADVLLEITVSSTTTVVFSIVDDWYNPVPAFVPGKYLVLLRSMGATIQGHYIGNKTN